MTSGSRPALWGNKLDSKLDVIALQGGKNKAFGDVGASLGTGLGP